MAYCVLCGKKVGLLDQIDLDFHGSKQVLCSACDVRMSKASPGERQDLEQQILASPHLQKADTVQANVNTGKVCPACGAILERKLEHFSIDADGGGGLMTLLADQYEVAKGALIKTLPGGEIVLVMSEGAADIMANLEKTLK